MTSPKFSRRVNTIDRNLILIVIALVVIIVDRVVKFYITERLIIGESINVWQNIIRISLAKNHGAAFSLFPGQTWIFVLASLAVFGLLIYFYPIIIRRNILIYASALVLGGAVGNTLDRIFFGYVIDYISLMIWPTFNIADICLTAGAVLLVIFFLGNDVVADKDKIDYARY